MGIHLDCIGMLAPATMLQSRPKKALTWCISAPLLENQTPHTKEVSRVNEEASGENQ